MSKIPKTELLELIFFVLALTFFVMSISFQNFWFGIGMALFAVCGFLFALVNEKKNQE